MTVGFFIYILLCSSLHQCLSSFFFHFCSLFLYIPSILQNTRSDPIKQNTIMKLALPIQYLYLRELLHSDYFRCGSFFFFFLTEALNLFLLMHKLYSWHFRREHFCQTTVYDLGNCMKFSKWIMPKSIQIANTFPKIEICWILYDSSICNWPTTLLPRYL